MMESNMFAIDAMQHVPVVRNAPNHGVYEPEYAHRSQDVTNSIEEAYEYSQPKSFLIPGNTQSNQEINNPFGTPAQFCLHYVSITDTSGLLQFTFDAAIQTQVQLNVLIADYPGIVLIGAYTGVLNELWIDFQNYVNFAITSANRINFVCQFRRKISQVIPSNRTPFNGPEQ